ncbi:MAG: AsmA family protein [Terriglobia bacterium]|jgi:AsmA protein
MRGKLRIVLIIVGVLIVLVLVAPFLIPVNQFRPTIEEKTSAALGRKVQLGNLSFSLLSGSLSAENLSIGDDPKFSSSPFLTAKSLKVGVEIMPLIFSKTINVTGITIVSPQVTLLRNAASQWNYSSLGGSSAKSSSPSNSSAGFSVKKLELGDGSIILGSTNSQKRSTYDHVNVTAADVSMTSKFPVTVTADLPGGGKFKLDGTVGPIDQADTSLTPLNAKLHISSLNLATMGFLDPSVGLGGMLDLDGTLASQNGEAESKGNAKLSKAVLIAGGSPAGAPVNVDFDTKYNLRKNSGVLNSSSLKIGSAAARLQGTYETAGEATVVNIKLDGKDMPAKDLEAFLPALGINIPKGASLQGGTLDADLTLAGPINKLVSTGTAGFFNGKLTGFDLGSKMSAISALTGLKTGKDLDIEKLTTNLRMAPDGLRADNFNASVPALGTLFGAGTIDAKNNLDFKMVATLTNSLVGAPGATSTSGGAAGVLGGLLGRIPGGGGGSTASNGRRIPFLIQGTTSDPKFIPDVKGLAADMLKSQLGPLASPSGTQQQQNNNPLGTLGGLFKKKKP